MTNDKCSIQEAKEKHQQAWLALPQVVSVGLALDEQRNQVIVIGVEQLEPEVVNACPKQVEGYSVILQEVGRPKTL